MKKKFEAFFTSQSNRQFQIALLYEGLLDRSIAPVDVPHKILKLLKVYHEFLEVDRADLKKSLNRVLAFTFNPSEKKELLEIEEKFFKSDKNKLSEKISDDDAFKVATMQFDEGRNFYTYIKMRRELAAYCECVSALLLQLQQEIAGDDLKYLVYDVYEKGSGAVLNAYFKDPVKDVRHLLENLTANEADESLLKLFSELTRILGAGNENSAAAALYKKQLDKIAELNFVPVPANDRLKFG